MSATFGPTRFSMIPSSTNDVRVTDIGGGPVIFVTPVSVSNGFISFELAAPGGYKIYVQNAAGYGATYDINLSGTGAGSSHQHDTIYAYIDSQLSAGAGSGGAPGTDANTPNTDVRRDANGRFKVGSPLDPADAANKGYVDGAVSGVVAGTVGDGSITDVKVSGSAAISLSKTADSTASTGRLALTNAERTKLGGIAAGATVNDTDANLKNRANHSGTQLANTISDLTEAVQDVVGSFVAGDGSTANVSYNDAAGTLVISSSGGAGGNAYVITDANAARVNPTTGQALPAGSSVIWVCATEPVNMTDDDLWFN